MKDTGIKRWRKAGLKYLAFGTAAATTLAGVALGVSASSADQPTLPTGTVSAAHGHGLNVDGLNLNIAGAAYTNTSSPTDVGPDTEALDVNVLGGLADLQIGNLNLPLLNDGTNNGLLSLGDLAAIESYSASPSEFSSISSSGILEADGSIDVGAATDPTFDPAVLDLTRLFGQLNATGLTDQILDEARIELGTLAAQTKKQGSPAASGQYMLADAQLQLHSKTIGSAVTAVDGVVGTAGTSINGLLGTNRAITNAVQTAVNTLGSLNVAGIGVQASLTELGIDTTGLVASVHADLLASAIHNGALADGSDASIVIELSSGTIFVNLQQLLIGPGGPHAGLTMSSLPANTDLLSANVVGALASGITNALTGTGPNSLTTKATAVIKKGIYDLGIQLEIKASVPLAGTSTILLEDAAGQPATIGGLLKIPGYSITGLEIHGGVLGTIGGLVTPILNTLLGTVGVALQGVVDAAVTNLSPLLNTALQPLLVTLLGNNGQLLKLVLSQLVKVTINEQPTSAPTNATGGDLGLGSFTVRAVAVDLLPVLGSSSVGLDLASATVLSKNPVATLTASPATVAVGETVTLSGVYFAPTSLMTFAVTPIAGTPPSSAVTTGSDGTFSGVVWTVPPGYDVGDNVTFTATDALGNSSTATVTIVGATLIASPNPVQPGGIVTLTGGNFLPGETVTVAYPGQCVPTDAVTPVVASSTGTFAVTCVIPGGTPDAVLTFTATGAGSNRTATAVTSLEAAVVAGANTNASASAAASAQANGDNLVAAQAAAQYAAMADQSTTADAAATAHAVAAANAAARATVTAGASTTASADATSAANASAATSAQASSNISSNPNANATAAASASGTVDARVASQASADAAADGSTSRANASTNATANTRANATASASASASAQANGNQDAAAVAAARAAAYSDATSIAEANSTASAAATADAEAAAKAAAYVDVDASASTDASANARPNANSSAQAAAMSTANTAATASAAATAVGSQNSDSDANGDNSNDFDSASSAEAAAMNSATSDSSGTTGASGVASQDAAATVRANANASASANASANADNHSNPSAQAAAQAAAFSAADNDTSAASTADTVAAAQAAARVNVQATASADASQNAGSSARTAATSTADTTAAQDASTTAEADVNAEASSKAAAQTNASTNASQNAAADVNASASAAASAQADSKANAAAEAAAETSAMANASTKATAKASAAATANAEAAAEAAAQIAARVNVRATASEDASQDTSAQANVAANIAAQASADHSADVNADTTSAATASVNANASSASEAAARVAANVNSTADASASASAAATAQATASAASKAASQGSANASGGQKLVNTGTTIGGFTAAGLVLLLIGSLVFIGSQRRKSVIQ